MQNNTENAVNTNAMQAPATRDNNADAILNDMIKSISRLHDVYLQETDALERSDTKRFIDLQEDKLIAAKDYQDQAHYVLRNRENMVNASPDLKKRIEELQKEFADISSQNNIALERMKRTTNRLSDSIRNAAKKAAQKKVAVNYGASGVMKSDERKIISTGIIETA